MLDRRASALAAAGVLASALGATVLVGWYLASPRIVQVVPGLAPMQPLTAVCFILFGAGMVAFAFGRRWWALGLLGAVGTLALLTVVEYVAAVEAGIDFSPRAELQAGLAHPGRMPLTSALSFLLLGAALALRLRARHKTTAARTSAALSLAVLALAAWVLLACLTSLYVHSGLWRFNPMALHSSAAFVLLAATLFGVVLHELRTAKQARDRRRRGTTTPRPGKAAWFALTVSMTLSIAAWYATAQRISEVAEARFGTLAQELELGLVGRLRDYEQALHGARGLMMASTDVTGTEWRTFVDAQRLGNRFPGILGVGYAAHMAGERYPVHHVEPVPEHGLPLLGFDMFSDPLRRPAMEEARDTGVAVLTAPLTLMQDRPSRETSGIVLYLPVYRGQDNPTELEERRARIQGFAFCAMRSREVLDALLADHGDQVALQALDVSDPHVPAPLYDSLRGNDGERSQPSVYALTREIEVAGRRWRLRFVSRPSFNASIPSQQPVAIMFVGSLLSVLVFGIAWSLSSTRLRALRIAKSVSYRLRDSERRYRDIVDHGRGLIWTHDLQGKMIYINPAAAALLGYMKDEVIGQSVTKFLRPERAEDLVEYMNHMALSGRATGSVTVVTRTGEQRTCQYDNRLRHSQQGPYVLAHAQDVTELRMAQEALEKAHEELREMATRDALTGLANRRLLFEHLAQGIEQCRRNDRMLGVIYLDLDKFKQVNDTLGHHVGDELLQRVAEVLRTCCRASDVPARLGGDEFVVMLTNLDDPHGAEIVASKIAARVPEVTAPIVGSIPVGASIGLALFPRDGADPETLVLRADSAMYRAKREGTGSYVFYS